MTPSAPHHRQHPGCASINSSRTVLGTRGCPHSHPVSPSMLQPEGPVSANSHARSLPHALPSLIRTSPEPSPALSRQRPRSSPWPQDLSWRSGPSHLSRHYLLPVCTAPPPRTAFALDLPPALQPLLLILREAIPGSWPKSTL